MGLGNNSVCHLFSDSDFAPFPYENRQLLLTMIFLVRTTLPQFIQTERRAFYVSMNAKYGWFSWISRSFWNLGSGQAEGTLFLFDRALFHRKFEDGVSISVLRNKVTTIHQKRMGFKTDEFSNFHNVALLEWNGV